jgi:hypothetical protein
MSDKEFDFREFAERVERLCDFILSRIPNDSADKRVVEQLKEDAADFQTKYEFHSISLFGLDDHMRGILTQK